jgi:hypothetical protein
MKRWRALKHASNLRNNMSNGYSPTYQGTEYQRLIANAPADVPPAAKVSISNPVPVDKAGASGVVVPAANRAGIKVDNAIG